MLRSKTFFTFLLLLVFPVLLCGESRAVPAAPDVFEIDQPDGHFFEAVKKGDEWNNWIETVEGYSIQKGNDNFWYYISHFDNDTPVLSNKPAHHIPPARLKKHIRPDRKFLKTHPESGRSISEEWRYSAVDDTGLEAMAAPGPLRAGAPMSTKVLFILAEFNDMAGTYTEADFASFITNNISDYFDKASFGLVTIVPANESSGTANNGVVNWVNVGMNHPNNTNKALVANNAIIAANPFVDYSVFDGDGDGFVDSDELAIVVITAGYECAYSPTPGDCMWGHRSSISSAPTLDGVVVGAYHGSRGGYAMFGEIHYNHQATMGIMVHELGHLVFNLSDLYDTDGSSAGIGAYGVMGSGSWGKASSEAYSGATPVLPCAWSRYSLGWIDGTEVSGAVTLTAPGSASANSSNTAYRLVTGSANEYFWIENRYPVGYDTGLQRWLGSGYGGGLNIWHIDKNKLNNREECVPPADCSSSHFMVAVEQADGNWDLENNTNRGNETDLWYSGNVGTFDNLSNPDSDLYDGTASSTSITSISVPGETMTATLSAPKVTVFEDNFESGTFTAEWSTSSTGDGRVLLTRNHYPGGKHHVVMDSAVDGSPSLNELILTLDLSGTTGVLLSFFAQEFGDENHSMPASFTGSGNYDGVAISEDGNIWYRVVDLGITMTNFQYTHFEVDLDDAIASAGISYNSTFKIKFQQYDDFRTTPDGVYYYDGITFDEIQLTATAPSCADNDEDGYGFPGDASCPNGSASDCDDSDNLEFPGQRWYEDIDGDSYSSGMYVDQCERPVGHYTIAELTSASGDCDDNDSAEHPGQVWYKDVDGDNYSDGTTNTTSCTRPTDYYIDSELTATSGDCNDNDVNLFPGSPAVRMTGEPLSYYSSLQTAYNTPGNDKTIQIKSETLTENITFGQNKAITLTGGFDCGFSAASGTTTVSGNLTINDGTVIIENVIIQ